MTIAAGSLVPESALPTLAGHDRELAALRAALAAALVLATDPCQPLALLTVHRTLGELAMIEGRHADAARHLDAALALADAVSARCAATAHPGGLSTREVEVLGLLAAGRSNREIGAALCVSPRTVQRHVANAYLKIGAHNKAEATAYALRHGLA